MQDAHTGLAGTFVIDAVKGIRVPIEQYEAEQALVALKSAPLEVLPSALKILKPSEAN